MFDLSPLSSHSSSLRDMTRRSLHALPTFCKSQWMQFQSRPEQLPRCLCHSEVWACEAASACHMQRTGPSWADSIKMISERHPEVSTTILRAVDEQQASPVSWGSYPLCRLWKKRVSFLPVGNSWRLVQSKFRTFSTPMATAARAAETHFWEGLMPTLSNRNASLLRPQGGPLASVPFTIFPTDRAETCGGTTGGAWMFAALATSLASLASARKLCRSPPAHAAHVFLARSKKSLQESTRS